MKNTYQDRYWTSPEGLKLHFRDYAAGAGDTATLPTIICLPGLTRNARDFSHLAERLSGERRVICIDNRGRGGSAYAADPMSYTPVTYVGDLMALLEQEKIERFVSVGTSLGGLMTMILASVAPHRLAGAVINDIGPAIDPGGISRIRDYVGHQKYYDNWMDAARALADTGGVTFPAYDLDDWLGMAKRAMAEGDDGRISFDYDMNIAEPFKQADNAVPPDLWPAYAALANCPLLVLRGELSDLLSNETVAEMAKHTPEAEFVTVGGVGHAPMLDEPEAVSAIDRLLDRIK